MYLLPREAPRLALILHPKTGTRSIERAITGVARAVRGRHGVSQHDLDHTLRNGGEIAGTVRNPFDTLVSWYYYQNRRVTNPANFEAWLRGFVERGTGWVKPNHPLFYGADSMTRVIRFESGLQTQLNELLADAGVPTVDVPHLGAANGRRHYAEYFCPRTIDIVYRRFESDFTRFGYSFRD